MYLKNCIFKFLFVFNAHLKLYTYISVYMYVSMTEYILCPIHAHKWLTSFYMCHPIKFLSANRPAAECQRDHVSWLLQKLCNLRCVLKWRFLIAETHQFLELLTLELSPILLLLSNAHEMLSVLAGFLDDEGWLWSLNFPIGPVCASYFQTWPVAEENTAIQRNCYILEVS